MNHEQQLAQLTERLDPASTDDELGALVCDADYLCAVAYEADRATAVEASIVARRAERLIVFRCTLPGMAGLGPPYRDQSGAYATAPSPDFGPKNDPENPENTRKTEV
ncbi:MAG: hypothetical protein OXG44_20610 [Gammaproteobacteria bacterium]|nr:hypothetical protein [Gammaproteobacteria bacterium]